MDERMTRNAVITSTSLGLKDHGVLTAWITLDYGGAGQGFGGFALDQDERHARENTVVYRGRNFAGHCGAWVRGILTVLEVNQWEDLAGQRIRVVATHRGVERIGHFLKDVWFDPEDVRVVGGTP